MKAEFRMHPRDLSADRGRDDWSKTLNALMGEFISDLVRIKGGGEYKVLVQMDRNLPTDYLVVYINASQGEGLVPYYPYAYDWERAPKWANWWTANCHGVTIWHEDKPSFSVDSGAWHSAHRITEASQKTIDIPLGIDWRTLCFERPESAVARIKMGTYREDEPSPTTDPNRWGFFDGLRKFIP